MEPSTWPRSSSTSSMLHTLLHQRLLQHPMPPLPPPSPFKPVPACHSPLPCLPFATVPAGHTLRLLQFPSTLEKGLSKLISLKESFGGLASQMTRMLGGPGSDNLMDQMMGKLDVLKVGREGGGGWRGAHGLCNPSGIMRYVAGMERNSKPL